MAVDPDAPTESVFAGDDTASPKIITWRFDDPDHLVVTAEASGVDPVTLVRGTHYSVAGSTVTPLAAIPVGTNWRIRRETPKGQPATLSETAYTPSQQQLGLDRLGMQIQEQDREIARAIKAPRGETIAALPAASDRALKALGFDSIGDPIAVESDEAELTALVAQASADATQTAADRVAVAADKITVAADKALTEGYKDDAETAATAALLAGNYAADVATGEATYAEGDVFYTIESGNAVFYQIVSGTGTAIGFTMASYSVVAPIVAAYPNLLTRVIRLEDELGLVHADYYAPEFTDDFETSGNLNGRTGWVVETLTGFASQINDITAANGAAGGTTGTGAYALHEAAVEDVRVEYTLANGANADQTLNLHASVDGESAATVDYFNFQTVLTGDTTGLIYFKKTVNGAKTTLAAFTNVRLEDGDTLRTDFSASGTLATVSMNGRPVGAAVDVSIGTHAGVAHTKKHGFKGNIGAEAVEAFAVIDRASEASLGLLQPNHVVARNSDGGVTWYLSGDYSEVEPTAIHVEVYDLNSTRTLVASGNLASMVAASGAWSGTFTATAAQAASAGPYVLELYRDGLLDANGDPASHRVYSPRQYPGYVHAVYGQSLATALATQTSLSGSRTVPTGARWIDGTPTNISTLGEDYTRYGLPIWPDTLTAELAAAFDDAASATSCWIKGGVGGQPVSALGVGSVPYLALLDGIEHAGGHLSLLHIVHGQADVTTDPATYKAAWHAIVTALAAANGGGTLNVVFHPLAAGWGSASGTNEQWQDIRRVAYELAQEYPAIYTLGAHIMDVQHADSLHPSSPDGYEEHNRRLAWAGAKALGLSSEDRSGPTLASVTKNSATEVYCLYDLNGADSLELVNTSYASEFHGGMCFSDAPTISGGDIANRIYPTNAVVDASPSGGQQGITFTLPSIAGTVYAFACWGKDPFNPNNTAAIQTDMAGKASMIRAVRSGEPSVGLQPYFSASGDYMSAS